MGSRQSVYSRALQAEYRNILTEPMTGKQISEKMGIPYVTVMAQLNRLVEQGFVTKAPRRNSNHEILFMLSDGTEVPVLQVGNSNMRVDAFLKKAGNLMFRNERVIAADYSMFGDKLATYLIKSIETAATDDDLDEYADRAEFREFLTDRIEKLKLLQDTMQSILDHPQIWEVDTISAFINKLDKSAIALMRRVVKGERKVND